MPGGWKCFKESLWCKDCWRKSYVLRAMTFPLAGPLPPLDWPKLREKLSAAWAQSTELANWIVTALAKADVVRTPDMDKCPPAPKVYLYPLARQRFRAMDPQSVVAVEHSVRGKYNKTRIDTIWRSNASLQRYRYPT